MLRFYTTYRTISPEGLLENRALLGAVLVAPDRWVFWRWNADPYGSPYREMTLRNLRAGENGVVEAEFVVGEGYPSVPIQFVPVDHAYVSENRDLYGFSPEQVRLLATPGTLDLAFQADLDDGYEAFYEQSKGDPSAAPSAPVEESQKPVAPQDDKYPLGALRLINGRFYEKTGVGTWVPTEWFP